MRTITTAAAAAMSLMLSACATTTTSERVWTAPAQGEVRTGRVEWVREIVQRTEGDQAAGAVAGAVVGGVLGHMLTGGSRGGTVVGAATGAVVGADASKGQSEVRTYDVAVRFDDGGQHVFRYRGPPPFRAGQSVVLTANGLMGYESVAPPQTTPSADESAPQDGANGETANPSTPVPSETPPPMASTTTAQPTVPAGQWAYTVQYGWVWMPYGAQYTFTPAYDYGNPYMYVYYPAVGWTWVDAPWLWGWGVVPYFPPGVHVTFGWYGRGWGVHWRGGYRPERYRHRTWIRSRVHHAPYYRPRPSHRPRGHRPRRR